MREKWARKYEIQKGRIEQTWGCNVNTKKGKVTIHNQKRKDKRVSNEHTRMSVHNIKIKKSYTKKIHDDTDRKKIIDDLKLTLLKIFA